MPAAAAPAATEATAPATPADTHAADEARREARMRALEVQLGELSRRLEASEKRAAEKPLAAAPPKAAAPKAPPHPLDHLQLSGYAQAQLEFHRDSEDQLAPSGQPLNQNRFLLRRARMKLESHHRYADFLLELDGNTVKGPSFGVQRAEVAAVYRGATDDERRAPLIAFTAGVLIPSFGRELSESPRERPFMERSLSSRAFFPSEPDVGVRLSGKVGAFVYGVSLVNGEPAGQPAGFPLRDPNSAKDIVGRVGVEAEASRAVSASGGVSLLNGKSTFRGTEGTKPVVTWVDLNEDGQLNNVELSTTPGSAPARSSNFSHWAVGADADVVIKTPLGRTELMAEVAIGSNLDRGLFVSDPITNGHDERQLGYYVGALQDVTRHALVGARFDYYDPRADLFTNKNGRVVPTKATVQTLSPLVGFRLPGRLKLLGQWDIIRDHLALDASGVPADRKNNAVTLRLQGEL